MADAWSHQYDRCQQLAADAAAAIQERNTRHPDGGPDASRLTAAARRALSSLASLLDALRGATVGAGDVTDGERNRRLDLIDGLTSRRAALQASLRRTSASGGAVGARDDAAAAVPSSSAPPPRETVATAALTTTDLISRQQAVLAAQDEALDGIEASARTVKHVALAVGDELDLQARLLDDLDDEVGGTGARLAAAARQLRGVAARSGGCRSLCQGVLGLLVVAVFAIIFIRIARLFG